MEMRQYKISVILPTLNEAQNIIPLIRRIYTSIPYVYEIIVVDDDSPDGTADIVLKFAKEFTCCPVRVERRLADHGLTKSIWHGIVCSRGDVVAWMDCDLSMPPEILPEMILALAHGYDISVGSRFIKGGSFKRGTDQTQDSAAAVILSRMMNYAIQFFLDYSFKDYTSGFVAARRFVFDDIRLRGDYGEYFIDFIFRAIRRGYKILEIPYICLPRCTGTSKTGSTLWQLCKRGWGYIRMVAALRLRVRAESKGLLKKRRIGQSAPPAVTGEIVIAPLAARDLPFVSGLHHALIPDTVNSHLGISFLHNLYSGILEDPKSRCWVALAGRNVVGFISVTLDVKETKSFLEKKMPKMDKFTALVHLLTHFRDSLIFVKQQLFFIYSLRQSTPLPTILTLAVSQVFQGKQVARQLIERAHDFFVTQRIKRYFVDTYETNHRAVAFYQKAGFEKVRSYAGRALFVRKV